MHTYKFMKLYFMVRNLYLDFSKCQPFVKYVCMYIRSRALTVWTWWEGLGSRGQGSGRWRGEGAGELGRMQKKGKGRDR